MFHFDCTCVNFFCFFLILFYFCNWYLGISMMALLKWYCTLMTLPPIYSDWELILSVQTRCDIWLCQTHHKTRIQKHAKSCPIAEIGPNQNQDQDTLLFFAKMNGYCACWTKISHQDFLRTYIVKWKTCAGWLFVCVRPSVRPSSRSVQFVVIWFIQWILLNRACWSIYIGFMSKPKRNLTRQYHNNKIICVGF